MKGKKNAFQNKKPFELPDIHYLLKIKLLAWMSKLTSFHLITLDMFYLFEPILAQNAKL